MVASETSLASLVATGRTAEGNVPRYGLHYEHRVGLPGESA